MVERRWPESKELVPRTQGRGSVLRCTKCSVTGFAGWLDHVPHEGLCSFRREGRDSAPAPSAECGRGAAANLLQRCCLGLKHGTECRARTLWVRVEGCSYSRQCVLEGGSLIPASAPCKLAGPKSWQDWVAGGSLGGVVAFPACLSHAGECFPSSAALRGTRTRVRS